MVRAQATTRMITADEIREVERRTNALHERVTETVRFRHKGAEERSRWQEACREFHAYQPPLFDLWSGEALESVRNTPGQWREAALLFLETDPWFFRSGYLKQKLLRMLKNADLTETDVERLNLILIKVVDYRDRREFNEYCRLSTKVGTGSLRNALRARESSSDEGIRRRARRMLEYVDAAIR